MKTAIVTGAARGIGLATSKLFLEDGWQVAMVDRDTQVLADASNGLRNVRAITADVSDPDQVAVVGLCRVRPTAEDGFGALLLSGEVEHAAHVDRLEAAAAGKDVGDLDQPFRRLVRRHLPGRAGNR